MQCPICESAASPLAPHPESDLYRCGSCTHVFGVPHQNETYGPEYYEETHRRWFEHPNVSLFTRITHMIPPSASVLDAGCGKGHFLQHLRALRPDLSLTGVDLSPNTSSNGIRFICGDIMSVDPGQFDVVVSLAVIEHIADAVGFSHRIRSFLRPGGFTVIMTVNESSLLYLLSRVGRFAGIPIAFNRLYSHHHLHHFTRRSLRKALLGAGLRVDSQFTHNAPLQAIDIPADGAIGLLLRAGMWAVCQAGEITSSSYLQTAVARISD